MNVCLFFIHWNNLKLIHMFPWYIKKYHYINKSNNFNIKLNYDLKTWKKQTSVILVMVRVIVIAPLSKCRFLPSRPSILLPLLFYGYEPLCLANIILCDALPSSLIDSNENLKWKQRKSKKLGHAPWLVTLWG
jgi:hypothetical protein